MVKRNMLLAALSLIAGLAAAPVQATEAAHVHRQPGAVADTGRVIVKYRANAAVLAATTGTATAQSARAGVQGVQAASRMSARLGLALTDGRALDARTQVLKSSALGSAALAKKLAQDSNVEWAVVDQRRFITSATAPNDPLYPDNLSASLSNLTAGQWYLRAPTATYASAINGPGAWASATGSNVVVAVLDTGIRPDHPDLAGNILSSGYDFISDAAIANDGDGCDSDPTDPGDWISQSDLSNATFSGCTVGDSSWHGTVVTGIIGATADNGVGIAGVAPHVSILPVRVLGKCGGYDSDIIAGMLWAAGLSVSGVPANTHPAKVLNMSLGSTGTCSSAYQDAVNQVNAAGAVVVAAAGNESVAAGAPANCSGVIGVAALRNVGTKAGYSSLGSTVSLSAPGGNCGSGATCAYAILSTTNSGSTTPATNTYSDATYASAEIGTSFAAPMVSGTAALMFSLNSSLTPTQVKSLLQASARSFPSTGGTAGISTCQAPSGSTTQDECYCTTSTCGAGMLDASAALSAVQGKVPPKVVLAFSPSSSVVVGNSVTLDASASSAASGASIAGYAWEIASGAGLASFTGSTSGSTATLVTTGIGTVTVKLTVTDSRGLSASSFETLTITAATPPTASFTVSSSSVVVGNSVTLDASGSTAASGASIASYAWAITSGSDIASFSGSTSGSTATLVTSGVGSVTVQLTVTDSRGVSASLSRTLTVTAATPPTASFTVSSSSVAAGNSVTLDASASSAASGASIASYAWAITSGGGIASFSGSTSGPTANLVTSGAGSVTVQLTVTDSLGSSASSSATITVTSPISGSGGGGALALWWQCGLLALGLLLRRRSA
jgi:serine protease